MRTPISFDREYVTALSAYLEDGGEIELSRAYEMGRRALAERVSVLDLVALHDDVLAGLVLAAPVASQSRLVKGGAAFVAEVLSPFEMTLRGYRQANLELQSLNEALIRQKAELEAVNRELEAFSYSVSHDLRAPLRSIDGFSQALLEDCGPLLDDGGKTYLRYVRESAQQMGQLIDDLLSLARVTRGTLNRSPVDLSTLARRTAERLHASAPQRSLELTIDESVLANADPRLLGIVLENLLGNAWKFTSKRDVARIAFGRTMSREQPAYFVRDNGAGFDMAYVGKLFGAFQRLHAAGEFEGTGIGLATVQRIIHRHGGEVWAEAAVDQGATFFFTLGHETTAP